MKTINRILVTIMFIFTCLAFVNCSEENVIEEPTTIENYTTDMFISSLESNYQPIVKLLKNKKVSGTLNHKNKYDDNSEEINEAMTPIIESSKKLISNYNFTDKEIKDELGIDSDKGAVIIAMLILEIEKNKQNNNTYSKSALKGDVYSCLAVATGIAGIYDLIQNTKSLAAFGEVATRKQALRLVGKLGRRALGWVGVILLVNDFGNCMNYWKNDL